MAMCAAASLVFSAMTVVPASAADPTLSVKVSDTDVEPGDEITLTVAIENNPGLNVAIYELTYDDTVFEIVPTSDSESGRYPDPANQPSTYPVTIGGTTVPLPVSDYDSWVNYMGTYDQKYVLGSILGPSTGVDENGEPLCNLEKSPQRFVWSNGSTTKSGNGAILEVTFKVKESAKAGSYTFDLDDLDFEVVDGSDLKPVSVSKKASDKIKVTASEVKPTGITVNPASIDLAKVGATAVITATVTPADATNKGVTYKSANEKIAKVDSAGNVTATGEGTTTITVAAAGATGVTKTVTVNVAHEHKLVKVEAKAATCTKEGNIEYYKCSVCGKFFSDAAGKNEIKESDTVIAKKAHDFTKKDTSAKYLKSAATCTKPAEYYYSCSVCGEKGTETFTYGEKDMTKHGDTKVVGAKEATYDTEGYTGDTVCVDCGTVIKTGEPIPVKEPTLVPEKAATCEEAGCKAHYERDDGTIWSKDDKTVQLTAADIAIPATGHDWGEPTYTFSADYSKCTAKRVCKKDASHVETETVDTVKNVTKEPTYDEKGAATYTADFKNSAFAQQTEDVTLPEKAHTYDAVDAKEATCEEDGNIAYYVRDDGLLFEDIAGTKETTAEAVKIPAKGHDYGEEYELNWAGDYTSVDRIYTCKNDKSHTLKVHADATVETQKEATCSEEGETVYVADFSEAKDGSDVERLTVTSDKLEHEWSDWEVTKEATEDEEGEETRTCAICGETETRAIPKIGDETSEGGDDENGEGGDDETSEGGEGENVDGEGEGGDDENGGDDGKESKGNGDGKESKGNGGENKGGSDNKGGNANGNGAATSNPVTGTAAALGVVAAALGSLAIFKKRK